MNRKTLYISILALITVFSCMAQKNYTAINYSMGFGTGELNDFISDFSPRGINLEYKSEIANSVYLGFSIGYQLFYDELPYGTYTEGTASISGYQTRYFTSVPALVTADYFFYDLGLAGDLVPYAGLGIGTSFNDRETDIGLYAFSEDTWFFTLKPELGVIYKFGYSTGAKLGVNYIQNFGNDDLDGHSFFTVDIGIVFMSR